MENTLLASKYKKFEKDTALMLWVLWDTENYDETEAKLINDHFIIQYFSNKDMRENLKVVDGKCNNKNGADVREVAKNYIEHLKLVLEIKPL